MEPALAAWEMPRGDGGMYHFDTYDMAQVIFSRIRLICTCIHKALHVVCMLIESCATVRVVIHMKQATSKALSVA